MPEYHLRDVRDQLGPPVTFTPATEPKVASGFKNISVVTVGKIINAGVIERIFRMFCRASRDQLFLYIKGDCHVILCGVSR
jgi:hypothetical protein